MARKLARIVAIKAITPIEKADAIEAAHVGGWTCVVKKADNYRAGDLAVYFEIDTFLPEGNPHWQFLVDKLPVEFNGTRGHVLRSMVMRGQVAQGLLLPLSILGPVGTLAEGQEVTEQLGVYKYEPPLPLDLQGKARGYRPSLVPGTDEERIQNLEDTLAEWYLESAAEVEPLTWEMSEKLEGHSCSWALLDQDFRVYSREVDYIESPDVPQWVAARKLDIEAKLRQRFGSRNIVLQGEIVGPGIEGNIYALKEYEFYLFRVYDPETGHFMEPAERQALAEELGVKHAPVLDAQFKLTPDIGMAELLAMADGPSVVNPLRRREGIVFKANGRRRLSFKVVSNLYLVNAKL